jgi:hypothetical protein
MIDKFTKPLFLGLIAWGISVAAAGQITRPGGTDEFIDRYLALRNTAWNGPEKILSNEEASALSALIDELKDLDSTSFAYHYLAYIDQPYRSGAVAHLKVAKQLRPSYEGVLHAAIQNAHFTGNSNALRNALQDFRSSSHNWTAEELTYHRHVLTSLPPKAILITNGDEDTHPLLLLQHLQGLRSDVFIIRADFLQHASFLKQTPVSAKGRQKFISASRSGAVAAAFNLFPAERIHLALTLPPSWLQRHNDGVINGLSIGRMHQNHTLEQLVKRTADISPVAINPSPQGAHRFDRNYLPLFVILENYHKVTGSGKAQGYSDAIARIKPKLKNQRVLDNLPR